MVDPSRAPLSGEVEVDETYVGGVAQGTRGRGAEKKTVVACAVERAERGMGRVRLAVIEDCSKAKLTAFVVGRLELETTVRTDGWRGYADLERSGYAHVRQVVDGSGLEAHVVLPSVHQVFSLLKRWMLGIHQGAVSRKHLQRYLSEFEFRFNRRTSHAPRPPLPAARGGRVKGRAQPIQKDRR